jgi:hypothetical protein
LVVTIDDKSPALVSGRERAKAAVSQAATRAEDFTLAHKKKLGALGFALITAAIVIIIVGIVSATAVSSSGNDHRATLFLDSGIGEQLT